MRVHFKKASGPPEHADISFLPTVNFGKSEYLGNVKPNLKVLDNDRMTGGNNIFCTEEIRQGFMNKVLHATPKEYVVKRTSKGKELAVKEQPGHQTPEEIVAKITPIKTESAPESVILELLARDLQLFEIIHLLSLAFYIGVKRKCMNTGNYTTNDA